MMRMSCASGGRRTDPPAVPARFVLLALVSSLGSCALHPYEARPLVPEAAASAFAERRLDGDELCTFARANLPSDAPFPPPAWTLETLALAAFFYRGELDVARAEAAAGQAAVTSAGARPNPVLSFDPEVVPGAAEPWILAFQLDLPIETAGKRGLRVRAAEERARGAELHIGLTAWQVRASVRAALAELRAAEDERALLEELQGLRAEHVAAQRARLVAGSLARSVPERDALELARAASQLERAQTRVENACGALAAALGVPHQALEDLVLAPAPEAWPAVPSCEELRTLGLTNRLDLQAELREHAATEAELRLELARQIPDFHLAPGTSWDQGDHKYLLGFALELPLFDHNEGPIAEAEARCAASAARFEALQDAIIGAIESARRAYAAALREREAAASELALARAEEQRAELAFEAGASDRLALLDAQLLRVELERALAERQSAVSSALGALEDELHVPLDARREGAQP